MALMKLSDRMSLQMKTVGKEQQFTEKNNGFLQNTDVAEGAMQKYVRAELSGTVSVWRLCWDSRMQTMRFASSGVGLTFFSTILLILTS